MAIFFKKVKTTPFALSGMAPTQITATESPRLQSSLLTDHTIFRGSLMSDGKRPATWLRTTALNLAKLSYYCYHYTVQQTATILWSNFSSRGNLLPHHPSLGKWGQWKSRDHNNLQNHKKICQFFHPIRQNWGRGKKEANKKKISLTCNKGGDRSAYHTTSCGHTRMIYIEQTWSNL